MTACAGESRIQRSLSGPSTSSLESISSAVLLRLPCRWRETVKADFFPRRSTNREAVKPCWSPFPFTISCSGLSASCSVTWAPTRS